MYTPHRSQRHSYIQMALPACLVVVVAVVATVVAVAPTGADGSAVFVDDPAAGFETAPAVDIGYTYTAPDGSESVGQFTITADGYATGTVIDQFAGDAVVHTSPTGTAVWGDEDWWSRRSPSQADQVKEQWVQPESGTVLPVDLAAEFNPSSLADRIRTINDAGEPVPDLTSYQGIPVEALVFEDWMLVRTASVPMQVLLLSGPIDTDSVQTAAAPGTDADSIRVPGDERTSEPNRATETADAGVGTLAVSPTRSSPATADATRETSGATMGETTDSKQPDSKGEPPPPLADFPAVAPDFRPTINASDCSTPTCSWTATVENTGTGPGEATITASVSPGMSAVTKSLGTIQPGEQVTTPTMKFANPAPKPAPGQTTSITVNYSVIIYSPQIGGSDAPRYRKLVDRLGGQQAQPALDRVLRPLAELARDVVVEVMHDLLDSDVSGTRALDAMDQATQADPARGEYADTPLLRRLAEAGDRFISWDLIADLLRGKGPAEYAAHLPGLDAVASELDDLAVSTVAISYIPGGRGAPMDAVVVSDLPSPEPTRCTAVTVVSDGNLAAGIERSVRNATREVDDCTVYVRLVIPQTNRDLWTAGPTTLESALRTAVADHCVGGDPGFERLGIVNNTGDHEWPMAMLCMSPTTFTPQEAVEHLNSLNLPEKVIRKLATDRLVSVNAQGEVTAVNWRDPERQCEPGYTNGGSSHKPTTENAKYFLDGQLAVFSAGYLCKPLKDGGKAKFDPLRDWPRAEIVLPDGSVTKNPRASEGGRSIFQRCHLVANILGGSGTDPGNLVTCYWQTNINMRSRIEKQVKEKVAGGEHVVYLALPVYQGKDGPLRGIRVIALGNKGFRCDVTFQNKLISPGMVYNLAC
ncbi:DNA/RNA non-specific endonuclease [Stackebrandtia endophytica]|uniref:DNA/RNA non-specific endonuclease n=2 Tax=Stackebrandtia endophytica TaxID=1496996 RepID=A0A543AUM6_9ACTN|nr:DNA/RNA non-specific endonuclease [Stackebrandtia endophytica]